MKSGKMVFVLLVALLVICVMPTMYLLADKPVACENEGGGGSVNLKSGHVGQSWESFSHEDCNVEPGQYLWHLVLSPVDKSATATINGVTGINHGASIHWTFINGSSTAPNWIAGVSSGLKYNPAQDCALKSELRVSHTCFGGTIENGDDEEEEEEQEEQEEKEEEQEEQKEEKITDLIKELPFTK